MNYLVQINWKGVWVTMPTNYASQDDAEWAIAKWKQNNDCTKDHSFRTIKTCDRALFAQEIGGEG